MHIKVSINFNIKMAGDHRLMSLTEYPPEALDQWIHEIKDVSRKRITYNRLLNTFINLLNVFYTVYCYYCTLLASFSSDNELKIKMSQKSVNGEHFTPILRKIHNILQQ